MKHIWAPWRMPYLENEGSEPGCLFCLRLQEQDGPENLILHRGRTAFIILNLYPYTNGHMMIVPFEHQGSTEDLDEAALLELMQLTNLAMAALRLTYGASSFNVGANLGQAAGAGIEDHVHLHILPRWDGDTNFMATTADTRVLPEALHRTYERLSAALEELSQEEESTR